MSISNVNQGNIDLAIPRITIHRILTVYLRMSPVVTRWVPKPLTDDNKLHRVAVCRELLKSWMNEDFLDRGSISKNRRQF